MRRVGACVLMSARRMEFPMGIHCMQLCCSTSVGMRDAPLQSGSCRRGTKTEPDHQQE